MQLAVDLDSNKINPLFLKYFWPALLSVVIKAAIIMMDGIFIGQGVGPLGLASVGLTMPLQTIFTALAVMVGVGGGALMSIEFGKGRIEEGQAVFSQSLVLLLVPTIVLACAGYIWMDPILGVLGAEGPLVETVKEYLPIMLIFYIFHVLAIALSIFLINDQNPSLPMLSMLFSAITSITLGYLFIFELSLGIKGAAYASVISQIVMLVVLLWHFIGKRGQLRFSIKTTTFNRVKEILHIGSPTFLLEVATIAIMLVFNYVLLNQYSENHLAAYGITMNLGMVLLFFLNSIGQACQPIFSFYQGRGCDERARATLKLGLGYSLAMGAIATLLVYINAPSLIELYIDDQPDVQMLALQATHFYFMAAILLGINLMSATFFQAINHPNKATLISLSRGFIFMLIGLIVLPQVFPEQGIWLLTLSAELITVMLSVFLLNKHYSPQPELVNS